MFGSQFSDRDFTDVPLSPYTVPPTFSPDAVVPLPLITSLIGGLATSLDGIPTANGALATDVTVLLSYGRVGQTWQLIDGTDDEAPSMGIVRPDDYDAVTNARIWVQL